ETANLRIGLFGSSTGAAAALMAAAHRADRVGAVVSRGGRVDLAEDELCHVRSPVLMLVGARDEQVLELNEQAALEVAPPWKLIVVRGATHVFEEPGALEEVAQRAALWFAQHLEEAGAPTAHV